MMKPQQHLDALPEEVKNIIRSALTIAVHSIRECKYDALDDEEMRRLNNQMECMDFVHDKIGRL
tara:strand:- start:39 stop:230 length:192 start_codon:yes stop_codon:yes gene_type:complete